jgi:hypothetical protein
LYFTDFENRMLETWAFGELIEEVSFRRLGESEGYMSGMGRLIRRKESFRIGSETTQTREL